MAQTETLEFRDRSERLSDNLEYWSCMTLSDELTTRYDPLLMVDADKKLTVRVVVDQAQLS